MIRRAFPILAFLITVSVGIGLNSPKCAGDTPPDDTKQIVQKPLSDGPAYAKRALVIGVDNYEHVAKLTDCANDARDFARMLKTKFGFDNITLMTDDPSTPDELKPTYTHILYQLRVLKEGIVPGQTQVVLFYSGHGTRTQSATTGDADWLIPLDGDAEEVSLTCVNYTAFKADLDTKRPARALLVMDACRDIDPGKGPNVGSGFGDSHDFLGPQIAELLSCQPTQVSHEGLPQDFHESVFTHFLIAGLEGDKNAVDGGRSAVTFDSLMQYVQGQVSDYVSRRYSGEVQVPDGDAKQGSMVLAGYAGPIAPAGPAPYVSPKGYQIMPPAGWKVDNSGIMGADLFILSPDNDGFTANLNVIVIEAPKGMTLEEFREQTKKGYQALTDYQQISQDYITIDGVRAICTVGDHTDDSSKDRLYMKQITTILNGNGYFFTFTAPAVGHEKYDSDFSNMIKSIQWQKAAGSN
jgi:hypothetical protein